MAISEGEYILMNMQIPKMVRDGRTGGQAKSWITDFIWKREVIDAAEEQTIRELYGMAPGPLPVIQWVYLNRVPTAVA